MNEEIKKPDQEQVKEETAKGPKAPQEKPVEEKKEAPAPQEKPASGEKKEEGAKKKKINRLRLKEVEKRIKEVEEKMGGLGSSFGRQLLKRKEQLLDRNPGGNGVDYERK